MSSADDYPGEMRKPWEFTDRTADDLVAGRATDVSDAEALQATLADLRRQADVPAPLPSPALAAVLTDGLPEAERIPVAAAPHRRPTPTPALPRRTSRMITALLSSVAAKAGLGVSAVALAVTGAGVADVLPSPAANDGIQRAVSAVTGVEFERAEETVGTEEHGEPAEQADFGQDTADEAKVKESGREFAEAIIMERRAERARAEAAGGPPENPTATGAEHANENARVPATVPADGQPDTTGQDRADEVRPAAPERQDTQQREQRQPEAPAQGGDAGATQGSAPAEPPPAGSDQAEAGQQNRDRGDAAAQEGQSRRPAPSDEE
jgi:hypothetical protein